MVCGIGVWYWCAVQARLLLIAKRKLVRKVCVRVEMFAPAARKRCRCHCHRRSSSLLVMKESDGKQRFDCEPLIRLQFWTDKASDAFNPL